MNSSTQNSLQNNMQDGIRSALPNSDQNSAQNGMSLPQYMSHPAPRNPSMFRATGIFMWRSFQSTKNNMFGFAMDTILAPILTMLIFSYLLGGAIAGSTTEYIQFFLPGVFILTVVPMTVYSGTSICTDISKGVYNRFRTMAFWQPSSILGPIVTDGLRYTTALLSALGTGMLIGFRPEGGVLGSALAVLFTIAFAFSVSWVFSLIGVLVKRPETVSGTSMIFVYPLMFASNILVDSSTMPRWMQLIVDLNPISIAAATVRDLMNGTADPVVLAKGIGVCLLIIVIFVPMTIYLYLNKNNR